jgi:hypothetical protein
MSLFLAALGAETAGFGALQCKPCVILSRRSNITLDELRNIHTVCHIAAGAGE